MEFVCIHRISIWSYCLKCDDDIPPAGVMALVPTGPNSPILERVA